MSISKITRSVKNIKPNHQFNLFPVSDFQKEEHFYLICCKQTLSVLMCKCYKLSMFYK